MYLSSTSEGLVLPNLTQNRQLRFLCGDRRGGRDHRVRGRRRLWGRAARLQHPWLPPHLPRAWMGPSSVGQGRVGGIRLVAQPPPGMGTQEVRDKAKVTVGACSRGHGGSPAQDSRCPAWQKPCLAPTWFHRDGLIHPPGHSTLVCWHIYMVPTGTATCALTPPPGIAHACASTHTQLHRHMHIHPPSTAHACAVAHSLGTNRHSHRCTHTSPRHCTHVCINTHSSKACAHTSPQALHMHIH